MTETYPDLNSLIAALADKTEALLLKKWRAKAPPHLGRVRARADRIVQRVCVDPFTGKVNASGAERLLDWFDGLDDEVAIAALRLIAR